MAYDCLRVKFSTLKPIQNDRHFTDDPFKCIFLNENEWISIEILLNFVSKGSINNIQAFVKIMAWRRQGEKAVIWTNVSLGLNYLISWNNFSCPMISFLNLSSLPAVLRVRHDESPSSLWNQSLKRINIPISTWKTHNVVEIRTGLIIVFPAGNQRYK